MSARIIQVNFTFDVSKNDLIQALAPHAQAYAEVSGLCWKIWLVNEEASEAGGFFKLAEPVPHDPVPMGHQPV